jgi:hypothetical protein
MALKAFLQGWGEGHDHQRNSGYSQGKMREEDEEIKHPWPSCCSKRNMVSGNIKMVNEIAGEKKTRGEKCRDHAAGMSTRMSGFNKTPASNDEKRAQTIEQSID